MPDAKRFSFTAGNNTLSESGLMPYLPITLHYQNNSIAILELLDTGASVNVLPITSVLNLVQSGIKKRQR